MNFDKFDGEFTAMCANVSDWTKEQFRKQDRLQKLILMADAVDKVAGMVKRSGSMVMTMLLPTPDNMEEDYPELAAAMDDYVNTFYDLLVDFSDADADLMLDTLQRISESDYDIPDDLDEMAQEGIDHLFDRVSRNSAETDAERERQGEPVFSKREFADFLDALKDIADIG